jgi:hypothetical protein
MIYILGDAFGYIITVQERILSPGIPATSKRAMMQRVGHGTTRNTVAVITRNGTNPMYYVVYKNGNVSLHRPYCITVYITELPIRIICNTAVASQQPELHPKYIECKHTNELK